MIFKETSIPVNFTQRMESFTWEWENQHTEIWYSVVFRAFSDFLTVFKSKEQGTSIAVRDLKGNFKMAAIVKYHPSEDENMPGNWSYEMTFDEKDIEGTVVYYTTDQQFNSMIGKTAHREANILLGLPNYTETLITTAIEIILQWLDLNAKENEVVTLKLENCFEAAVEVEAGKKIMSITPGEQMKRIIKGDADIEV